MSEAQYTISGRELYSAKGKLVATLDADGNPIFAPGMAGAHSRAVNAFLASTATTPDPAADQTPPKMPEYEPPADNMPQGDLSKGRRGDEAEGNTTVYVGRIPAARPEGGVPEEARQQPETLDEYSISTIPDDELPPFSKEYGVNTPGFEDFVKLHKLTGPQVAALIKRLTSFPREKK